jgi:outer membrane receptor protein involved in Fe transport
MKRFTVVALLTLVSSWVIAQMPNMGGNRGAGGNMNMGHIYGKILDARTGKPLEAVSVQVVQSKFDTATKKRKDAIIAGQLTKPNGDFSIENLPIMAPVKVKFSAIGYKLKEQNVQFTIDMTKMRSGDMNAMLNAIDKDLGNIKLETDVKQEETVTVVGQRSTQLQLGIDRKIFNVEKNLVSQGGTALDVMKNVPSVQVDIEGNVTLRNNSPQIFVDGRPTTMSLDQIPADAIASVELITNPSAKFDASGGTSGIINVVLKKNRKTGYNGNLRANIDSRAKVGAGADINVRQEKINMFLMGNYNQRKTISWGESDRLNLYDNPQTSITQRNNNESQGRFMFFRGGMDFFIDNRNTFSLAGNIMGGKFLPYEIIDIYQNFGVNGAYNSYRTTDGTNKMRNAGGTASFKHLFAKAGREWTADLTLNRGRNFNNSEFVTSPYTFNGNAQLAKQIQQINANGGSRNITAQTDYAHPFNDNVKIEAGLRYNERNVYSVNDNYLKIPGTTTLTYVPELGYNFENTEKIFAAYTTYGQKINKTSVQLGLRWESSDYEGNLLSRNQKFSTKYPNSFFPSLFITQSLGKGADLQVNYTRKINRPNFWQLLPYIDYADSLNISRGNPGLIPEFTNNGEISLQLPYGKNSTFLGSVYYKNTSNLITRFQGKENLAGRDVIVSSYINANQSYVYGLELTNKNSLTNWWDLATNVNFYGSQLKVNGQPDVTDGLSWFSKINSTMRLPKNFTFQVSGDYQSRSVMPPGGTGGGSLFGGGGGGFGGRGGGHMFGQVSTATQGYIKANWGVDIAIRKEFLKDKKASISLNINDIFRTKRSFIHSESDLFVQDYWRQRDPQVARLNFSYRFGKLDALLFKRKNMKGEREGMQSGMEGGGMQ